MLETCRSISQCEETLSKKMQNTHFIAQIELSRQDLKILEDFIYQSVNTQGVYKAKVYLKYKFPFCTAFYMVYKGVWEYSAGNYWGYLSPLPDISTPAGQSEWGEWLLHFLKIHNLVEFNNIERTYKYVTPILIHGGIPQSCIENFFDKVVMPLIKQDYTTKEQVADFLYSYRIREKEILRLEGQIQILEDRLLKMKKGKKFAEKIIQKFNKLCTFSNFSEAVHNENDGLFYNHIKAVYNNSQQELERIENYIRDLEIKHKRWERAAYYIDDIKGKCLEIEDIIFELQLYLGFLEQLETKIIRTGKQRSNWCLCNCKSTFLKHYTNKRRTYVQKLNNLLARSINTMKDLQLELKRIFDHILSVYLLIENQFGLKMEYRQAVQETAASLDDPGFTVITRENMETIKQVLRDILSWQDELYNKIGEYIQNTINEIYHKKQQMNELDENIKRMEFLCTYLGDGYLDRGFLRISQWISNEGKIKAEKISEIYLLEQDLKNKKNRIKRLSCFVQYADRAVQYFLLYGGDWAEDWLTAGVEMTLNAVEGKALSDIKNYISSVPGRFIDVFCQWWQKQLQSSDTINSFYNSSERVAQRFTTPVLLLDPLFGELKIIVGIQRLLISGDVASPDLYIKIEEGNREPVFIPLRCYRAREEKLIETREIEYKINYLVSNYTVSLVGKDETYRTWEIQGIDWNIPFMVFNGKGEHISGNICPKGEAWVLIQRDYELKSNMRILEEIDHPGILEDFRIMLVDFTNADSVFIAKDNGEGGEIIPCSIESEEPKPYLTDASYVPGLFISGVPVCDRNIPGIAVPMSQENGLEGWSIIIRKGKKLRKYFRLSELSSAILYPDKKYAKIDLAECLALESNLTGFYSIYLRNPMGEEFNYEFTFIPDLIVDFDTAIHFPSDESDTAGITLIFPSEVSFTADVPAIILDITDEAYDIEVPWEAGELTGEITIGKKEVFSFKLELPNIKWRIQGLGQSTTDDWNILKKEIWVDGWENYDTLLLHLRIPSILANSSTYYYEVGLHDYNHYVSGIFTNNKASVNLLQFMDTINDNAKFHTFSINIYDKKFKLLGQGTLFNIVNWWEIRNLQWETNRQDEDVILKICWDDLGKASDRILQLWRSWEPWETPLKYDIPDGVNYVQIHEKDSCLKEGRYLACFDTEGPWDQPVSSAFPSKWDNIHFIEVNCGTPQVRDLNFIYDSYGNIKVRVTILGADEGNKIECFFIGLLKGEPVVWKDSSILGFDRSFSISVSDKVKKWAHWLVIKGVDIPVYRVSIMPEAAPIEFRIPESFGIVQQDMVSYIKAVIDENNRESYEFTGKMIKNILNMYTAGKGEAELTLNKKEKEEKLKLIFEDNQYFLMIRNGVKCTSCGAVLEDQFIWHQEHYPRCKKFIAKYTDKMKISVIAGIDSRLLLKRFQEMYSAAGTDLLELYSNIHNPHSRLLNIGSRWIEEPVQLKNLILNLIDCEMKRLKISIRGDKCYER